MNQDYALAQAFVTALTGNPDAVISWRVIHDKDKGALGKNIAGTLQECWQQLCNFNADGWGVFCNINEMDLLGSELANVSACRAHVIDLDDPMTAQQSYLQAVNGVPAPQFAVQSSPGKFHVYWKVQPYTGNDFYTLQQRRLIQLFNSDKSIIDATRVMRVPGFIHAKREPFLVNFTTLPAYDNIVPTADQFAAMLSHVNIIEHISSRAPLGSPEMSAPSFKWLQLALSLMNPNELDRQEWLSLTAAIKQAGWTLADEQSLRGLWDQWCAQYDQNDPAVNDKLWNSIRDTEVGWQSIERKSTVQAYQKFGFKGENAPDPKPMLPAPAPAENMGEIAVVTTGLPAMPEFNSPPPAAAELGEILDATECAQYFKDCYFIGNVGRIFSLAGRFMDSSKFNGMYGGKHFIITSTGKITDEAWKAALRSTVYCIPKVDHTRFLPDEPLFALITDSMGRTGLNTYIKPRIDAQAGDVSRFFDHMARILPDEGDRRLIYEYMAHAVKFPGFKIPWAPLIQSAEGIGKTVFTEIMQHALGDMYVYRPKAPELIKSGSTFNAWMESKLMIMVDEIKIDERLELIEILKPMISDARIEIQAKGVDQEMKDNAANWFFFSNYKDAIPIKKNGRRYAIFYSALQSLADILAAGMDDKYFNDLFAWLRTGGGLSAITHWLMNYPIERGGISARAPFTSSYDEALKLSRSPMEVIICDAITDQISGFRGGYVSVTMAIARSKNAGLRNVTAKAVAGCLEGMGYHPIGRTVRPYLQEDASSRSEIFANIASLPIADYGRIQGYE